MDYYAILKGVQIGPIDSENLLALPGFSDRTMVWCEGLTDWVPASDVPELSAMLGKRAEQCSQVPPPLAEATEGTYGPQIKYRGDTVYSNQNIFAPDPSQRPYNWTGWSIFNIVIGLLFGFFACILGVVGLIYALKANECFQKCDYVGARSAARTAKIVNIIALAILGLCILFVIVIIIAVIPFIP